MSLDSPQSSRNELEARLTALLLGELSAEEEASLRLALAQDPELAQLHDQLARIMGLVRQAATSLEEEAAAPVEPLKLSPERRARLFQSLREVHPKELASARRVNWREWGALAAMILVLLVLAAGSGIEFRGPRIVSKLSLVEGIGDEIRGTSSSTPSLAFMLNGSDTAAGHDRLERSQFAPLQPTPSSVSPVVSGALAVDESLAAASPPSLVESHPEISRNLQESDVDKKGLPDSLTTLAPHANAFGDENRPRGTAGVRAVADLMAIQASGNLGIPQAPAAQVGGVAGGRPLITSDARVAMNEPQGGQNIPRFDSRKGGVTFLGSSSFNKSSAQPARQSVTEGGAEAILKYKVNGSVEAREKVELQTTEAVKQVEDLQKERSQVKADGDLDKPIVARPIPQPEMSTAESAFSTFSLNVTDVSFKLAAASLEQGQMPDPTTVRSEEFINAFDYRDAEPIGRAPIAFAWERARYPFEHDRDLLRFSVKTAAVGRQSNRSLNLVLLLDNSGSMERADRVLIRQECLRVIARQLHPKDRVSVVAFARSARLWVDGLPGSQAGELPQRVGDLTPEGGTNLEEAMNVAYQTALRHFIPDGVNRVVLLTDGAANLGDVEPESLKRKVETHRSQGIALDCFGIGWDGFNDPLMEALARNGDGRYGFVNTPEAATTEFASQLLGALQIAASDVKVQVEWNPRRVSTYRQIGYAKHQLTKEQFRDNTVDAAEIGAAEAGNALYTVQVNPAGEGPLGLVRVRFKLPGTSEYQEHEWPLAYDGGAKSLDQSSAALRLAASASSFSEWLVSSPFAAEVTPDKLLGYLRGVPELWPSDPRPKKLEWMIRQAGSLTAK